MRFAALLAACCCALFAEVHKYTLKESVDRAVRQSPDILMARFDEAKAVENVLQVKDPFTPKLVVGSGLAYTSGFPMSIEGLRPRSFRLGRSRLSMTARLVFRSRRLARTPAELPSTQHRGGMKWYIGSPRCTWRRSDPPAARNCCGRRSPVSQRSQMLSGPSPGRPRTRDRSPGGGSEGRPGPAAAAGTRERTGAQRNGSCGGAAGFDPTTASSR